MDMEEFCIDHCPMPTRIPDRTLELEVDCDCEESECPFNKVDFSKVNLNPLGFPYPEKELAIAQAQLAKAYKPREGLRQELIDWITTYKDVAERNALAETPEESADYLLALLGLREKK